MKKGIADISFFLSLQNSRNRHRVFNDDVFDSSPTDIDKITSAVQDWMDEIEDMRAIDPSVDAEASGEETKMKKILKSTYDRITAATASCRLLKTRLQKDRPWEADEEVETESQSQSQPESGSTEETTDEGGFDDLLSGGGEAESTEEEQ